jgi:hypothetical protein
MVPSKNPQEISGADQFDPLNPRRQFSWKVFFVAGAIIMGTFLLSNEFSDVGFGIAMAVCGVVAIAIAAPSAFSERWFSDSMPDVATMLDSGEAASSKTAKSNESDAP